jgi:predicted metal-dependent peptidase
MLVNTQLNPIEALSRRVSKNTSKLMQHPETRRFAPFFGKGNWDIDPACATAYTDGKKIVYGLDWPSSLSDGELRFLILHEYGHDFLMHILRITPRMKQRRDIWGKAVDYVVNAFIMALEDKTLCVPPKSIPPLFDPKYIGWSVPEVFNDLLKQEEQDKQQNKQPQNQPTLDEMDPTTIDSMPDDQVQEAIRETGEALRQGGMMAGLLSTDAMSRAVEAALAVEINWEHETEEFVTEACDGRGELTFRRLDRRALADDRYMPSQESEVIEEVLLAIDASGSTYGELLNRFVYTAFDLCQRIKPQRLRILWWDTSVKGEQVFEGDYSNLPELMQLRGGGGTNVSSVSKFIHANGYTPNVVVVFTDGYVESGIQWDVTAPTLWLVTDNKHFTAPVGRVLNIS